MSNFSFSSQKRLRRASEFDVVLKTGKRMSLSCFSLCFTKNTFENARLGIMYAKRHCPLSVDRNRIKRITREAFRTKQALLPPLDLVFLLRQKTALLSDEALHTCIDELFTKLITTCAASA